MTVDETLLHFPCDEWVKRPTLVAWRGVTVRTSAKDLWPWVTQVRLAPYSYDWIDNLGRRSPQAVVALPAPIVGENFTSVAGKKVGRILSVDQCHHVTGRIAGAVISYVLLQHPDAPTTRLIMKVTTELPRPLAPLLSLGDLVMARRQLLNWKHLAERSSTPPVSGTPPRSPRAL